MKMPNEVGPLRSHFDVQWKPKKINAKTRSETVALIFKALANSCPMETDSKECTPKPHKLNTTAHKQKQCF